MHNLTLSCPLFSMKIIAKLSMISLLMGPFMLWANPVDTSPSAVSASDDAAQAQAQAPLKVVPLSQAEQSYIRKCYFQAYPPHMEKAKARNTLQILLKGDWDTIDCYRNAKDKTLEERKECYYDDLATMLDLACSGPPSEEKFRQTLEVITNRPSHLTFHIAAQIFADYPGKARIAIPYLKEWMDWKGHPMAEDSLKISTAYTLAMLGEHDLALDYFRDLALSNRDHAQAAIQWLFKYKNGMACGLWDERGYQILLDALRGGTLEVKGLAAERLLEMGKEVVESKKMLFSSVEELKFKTVEDYGGDHMHSEMHFAEEDRYSSDRRACNRAFHLLGQYETDKIKPLLEYLKEQNKGWWYVCDSNTAKNALSAIEYMQKKNKK